jgi:hypothetical protein
VGSWDGVRLTPSRTLADASGVSQGSRTPVAAGGALRRGLVAVVVGLLTGALTLAGQAVLPEEWNRLANSGAIWVAVAFFVGSLSRSDREALALGTVTLLAALLGYQLEALAAVHEATPPGWYVGRPSYQVERDRWIMFAFDPSEKAVMGQRERQWETEAMTEVGVVRSMAYCLGELREGRWPK